jgi:DNA-binding protein HU-beta
VNLIDINKRRHAMNKAELVEEVAGKVGLTKKETNNVVDAITSAITDSLARDERVTLVGFGTFQVRERKARKGVNPQTRRNIQIPAKRVPKFKPGRGLREKVR